MAKSGVDGGGAIRGRMLENGHGGGFLGEASVDHGDNSYSGQKRNGHERNDDVVVTGRQSHEEKEATEKENHGVGDAQDDGGPSQVIKL